MRDLQRTIVFRVLYFLIVPYILFSKILKYRACSLNDIYSRCLPLFESRYLICSFISLFKVTIGLPYVFLWKRQKRLNICESALSLLLVVVLVRLFSQDFAKF